MRSVLLTLCLALLPTLACAGAEPAKTATGIPLDAPWKVQLYTFARSHFVHPAWGWQHSERKYQVGLRLAQGDNVHIDADVLFAASFLHDMAAFQPCADRKMEHGDCAAQQSGALLSRMGFPMAKLPGVLAAERAHMYNRTPKSRYPESVVLHDADSLDFLGGIGAARLLSLTGEKGASFA
nr:hypothetical protein [Candidatus Eremiobacteraeota bacterium]